MASRVTFTVTGIVFMLLGVFGKFGAILSCIPDPIIGGLTVVALSMLFACAASNLQFVDLGSTRNLMILGVSHIMGLMVPFWLQDHPEAINTGGTIKSLRYLSTIYVLCDQCTTDTFDMSM